MEVSVGGEKKVFIVAADPSGAPRWAHGEMVLPAGAPIFLDAKSFPIGTRVVVSEPSIDPAELAAELDRIEAEPLTDEQVDHIVRSVKHARLCDGCGQQRPYDPERPDQWKTEDADGCLWHYCPACRRHLRK